LSIVTIFVSTFLLVFIGELGDKTQFAAGTATLANRNQTRIILASSVLALVLVSGITVFFAGLIPETLLPKIVGFGGLALIGYGCYLYIDANKTDNELIENPFKKNRWALFWSHFSVVFIAELGDKTQIATLAAAVANRTHLFIVFSASALALISVTLITVWGITKVPPEFTTRAQKIGAVLMGFYGIFMAWEILPAGNL
jgi:putative Ca2+/H+ antiporter (TMEM165/GDT1 family)